MVREPGTTRIRSATGARLLAAERDKAVESSLNGALPTSVRIILFLQASENKTIRESNK